MRDWEYADFTAAVHQLTGIDLTAYNERQMKRRIDSFILRNRCQNYSDYYRAISSDRGSLKKFANFITINVTEFFRNPPQWEKLRSDILPGLMKLRGPMKIWSSACSTGEEPYSLVLLLNQFMDLNAIHLLATDIDEGAIAKARQGVYLRDSLKNLPEGYTEKYFDCRKDQYQIKDKVKACVEFRKLNLLKDSYPKGCHLILCRNVMIYFTQEAKDRMYQRFHDALLPGGILFLGNTEQILNPVKYGLVSLRSFFYSKTIEKSTSLTERVGNQ